MAGRRDEKARQVLASYVREITIDPTTKKGCLVLNDVLGPPAPKAARSKKSKNNRDRPSKKGRSQVANVEDG